MQYSEQEKEVNKIVNAKVIFWWSGFISGAFLLTDGLFTAAKPFVDLVQAPFIPSVPWLTVQNIVGASAVIAGFMTFKGRK